MQKPSDVTVRDAPSDSSSTDSSAEFWLDYKDSTQLLCDGFVRGYLSKIRFDDISSIVASYLLLYEMNVESIVVWCF